MAESPSNIKQEMEMSMAEELAPESLGQSQETLMIEEMIERGYWSLGASQWQQKLDSTAAGSAAGQPVWNMTATWPKNLGTQLQIPIMSNEPGHEDVYPQEYPGGFQGMRVQYECNPEADLIAEIGLEELNGLEIEVMRRQMDVITERLCALEDQVTTWRYKGALFFTMLMSACAVNLWLWMRH